MDERNEQNSSVPKLAQRSWARLEHLGEIISPVSFFVLFVAMLPTMIVLFEPGYREIFILCLTEFGSSALARLWDGPLYQLYAPEAALVFPNTDLAALGALPLAERIEQFQIMAAFPAKRAMYAVWASYLKTSVTVLGIVLAWRYSWPASEQIRRVLIWLTLNFLSFYTVVYYDSHDFLTRKVAELHERHDWSDVFKQVRWNETDKWFGAHEITALLAIMGYVLIAQWVLISGSQSSNPQIAPKVMLVGVAGMLSLGWIWSLSRGFLVAALSNLRIAFQGQRPAGAPAALPLPTQAFLGRLVQTYNELTERLRAHEHELSHFVSARTEEQRLVALAEISAMVVHDLSSPLQAIRLAADVCEKDREKLHSPDSLDAIILNSTRTLELVESLRTYLRASAPPELSARVGEVYRYVIRILGTRYPDHKFGILDCRLDPALDDVLVRISRADLIHVLMNVLSNSVDATLSEANVRPVIWVSLAHREANRVVIAVQDNGRGLSPERYDEMTGLTFLTQKQLGVPQSLGLRLVRRLVEKNGGALTVERRPDGERGTRFLLRLDEAV